jgi:hypothetical protein
LETTAVTSDAANGATSTVANKGAAVLITFWVAVPPKTEPATSSRSYQQDFQQMFLRRFC